MDSPAQSDVWAQWAAWQAARWQAQLEVVRPHQASRVLYLSRSSMRQVRHRSLRQCCTRAHHQARRAVYGSPQAQSPNSASMCRRRLARAATCDSARGALRCYSRRSGACQSPAASMQVPCLRFMCHVRMPTAAVTVSCSCVRVRVDDLDCVASDRVRHRQRVCARADEHADARESDPAHICEFKGAQALLEANLTALPALTSAEADHTDDVAWVLSSIRAARCGAPASPMTPLLQG